MNILITGSNGFIAKNLIAELSDKKYENVYNIFKYDINDDHNVLDEYTKKCDFVIHLAGVNRTNNIDDYQKGNAGFTSLLLSKLKKNNNKSTILITSSIQAILDNPYGKSKKEAEEHITKYGKENHVKTCIYRMPNVFGKWCKPNYNSVVATFCYNIANGISIQINDRSNDLNLIYIDDLIHEIIRAINGNENRKDEYCYVEPVYNISLKVMADLLYYYREKRENGRIPEMHNELEKKLYSTYISYLPINGFACELDMKCDSRGSFSEMLKMGNFGQISISITDIGITRGNHWHHTKNEKFLVVSGYAVIRLRRVDKDEIIEYIVSEEKLEMIDIPSGYTHNITNIGDKKLVTIIWSNEIYSVDNPDTIYLEV